MFKFLPLFALLLLLINSRSENKATKMGIDFFKGTFSEALAASKETGKPIFIDFYTTWCGPCKQLKKVSFKDKAVGEYYNKNFICISVDAEKGEGIEVARQYNVRSYPTLLIINNNGAVKARTEGFMKPYILINFGRRVVP
jgi:thiol:disulfide interchange protein